MKKNKKIIVSAVSALALLLNLFLPAAAWAYTLSLPSLTNGGSVNIDVNKILQEANTTGISSVSSQLEDRYGLNKGAWTTAQRKVTAPKVEISFDNTNPKVGEKVTANAVPEYFKNDPQNLYYTWYIIHTTDGTIKTATNSIESGKKEAAKIMARGDYDPDLDGQTYSDSGKDPDSDGWPSVDSNSYDESASAAPMGGADGVGGLAKDSDNLDPSLSAYCSPKSKASRCNLYTTTDSFDSYYKFSGTQSDRYCSSCSSQTLSWGTLSSNNQCCYLIANPTDTEYASYDSATAYCPTAYNSAYESCFNYASLKTTNQSAIESCLYTECKADYDTIHSSSTVSGDNGSDFSRCFKHDFGTSSNASGYQGYEGSSGSYGNDDSGLDYNVTCKHKWKDATGYTSGSGKLTTGEEEYWKTDPTDPDTDGDGFVDGADVIGLGQQDFTWTYQSGDRVGVVIEGTSMIPTDEKTAYYKIMWSYLDVCDSTKTGLLDNDECDSSGDYGYGFLATESPNEQGDDKLKISLSFSPDTPLADPSDENKDNISDDGTIADADQITVSSSLDNTDSNPGNLYYTWQISKGDPQKDDWTEVKDIPENFLTASPTAGMGISEFSFVPKKSAFSSSSGVNYFKVTLTASKASGVAAGRGRSSVIIPVNTQGVKIILHKVDIKDGKAVVGEEICNDGLYKTLCPVVHGQMLAAEVSGSRYKSSDSEFSWKVNDSPAYPPANVSELFDGWSNTTVFFPITKEEQGIENISVTATKKDELQPVTGARFATVVHPAVFIKSGDTSLSWPKTYVAEDPNKKSAYQNIESSDAFEALPSSDAPFYLDFVPYYLLGEDSNSQINWSVNGTDITSPDFYANNPYLQQIALENNDRTIKLNTGENIGTFTTLSAQVKKYWIEDERSIAYTAWGVAPNTLSGDSSVSIESVSAPASDIVGSAQNSGQILAAIGTHLPHYFMYLLRLVLTMAVMFVVSAGFYGVTQRLNFADDEK